MNENRHKEGVAGTGSHSSLILPLSALFSRVSRLRFIVQALFFVLFVYAGLLGMRRLTIGGREPSLPTLSCEYARQKVMKCYLHDLQTFLTRGAADRYVSLIEPTAFFLLFCLLAGRAWCGWACPLGFLQDCVSRVRAWLGLGFVRAGPRARNAFAWTAYVFLGLAVFLSVFIGRPKSRLYPMQASLTAPYCLICPARQMLPLLQGDANNFLLFDQFTAVTKVMSILGMVTVAMFLLGSPVMRRFWCRFCAMGILMRFLRINRWARLGLVKDPHRCTYCGSCERACPVDITEIYEEREDASARVPACHLCLQCVEACPEDGALEARWFGRKIFRSRFAYVFQKMN